jgi:hypothetical protein
MGTMIPAQVRHLARIAPPHGIAFSRTKIYLLQVYSNLFDFTHENSLISSARAKLAGVTILKLLAVTSTRLLRNNRNNNIS